MKQKDLLEPFAYDPKFLGPQDVELQITHCGICHSDIHLIDDDWGWTLYPLVPGHEIIGQIINLGSEVTHVKKGDRVGIGWQRSSCLHCSFCKQGDENLCAQSQATCVGYFGGFAERIRSDSRFVFPIPDALRSEEAAPLLCAGATVFSPLINYHINALTRIGVIGIGGLGHLAIQFAHAFGCEVIAFSSSKEKEKEAKELGADQFVLTSDQAKMASFSRSIDLLLSTVSSVSSWDVFFDLIRPRGTFCHLGVPGKKLELSIMTLIDGRRSLSGSNIASRNEIDKMLQFAASKGIRPRVEVFPMSDVNKAIEKVRANQVRYRAVLKN